MVKSVLVAAAVSAIWGAGLGLPAAAQDGGVGQLFISPAGEPFRAGLSAPYPSAAWFAKADADGDGKITKTEFRADHMRAFKLYDADRDGQLDDAEFTRYEQRGVPEILTRAFTAPQAKKPAYQNNLAGGTRLSARAAIKEGQARAGAGYFGFLDDPQPVRSADWDFNSKVSETEWQAAADRRFTRLANGAAEITFAALPGVPFDFLRKQ